MATLLEDSMPELQGIRDSIDSLMQEVLADFEHSTAELSRLRLRHKMCESETNAKVEGLLALLGQSDTSPAAVRDPAEQCVHNEEHKTGPTLDKLRLELFAEAVDKARAIEEDRKAHREDVQRLEEELHRQKHSHEEAIAKLSAESDSKVVEASKRAEELEVKLIEMEDRLRKADIHAGELATDLAFAEQRANRAERSIAEKYRDHMCTCHCALRRSGLVQLERHAKTCRSKSKLTTIKTIKNTVYPSPLPLSRGATAKKPIGA
eukprot:TRINITY_DN109452_c0_g1_i1.p1 TRINITY_DN109452_c0_g1~~TRINITY_DN109452_c0_g1_i1.p1  ORF type:complete len:289 (-),score=41.67 TRINITY_DN109452_c0_g1_i1:62-853(-)